MNDKLKETVDRLLSTPPKRIEDLFEEVEAFDVGQRVYGTGNPFWMTITKILPNGRYQCCFGISENDAGSWAAQDLRHEEEA